MENIDWFRVYELLFAVIGPVLIALIGAYLMKIRAWVKQSQTKIDDGAWDNLVEEALKAGWISKEAFDKLHLMPPK